MLESEIGVLVKRFRVAIFGATATLLALAALPCAGLAAGWRVEASFNKLQLTGVSCWSQRGCTAVGWSIVSQMGAGYPAAETWDGLHWAPDAVLQLPQQNQSVLWDASCARSVCAAVGSYKGHALTARLAGRRWVIQRAPSPQRSASLKSISCVSAHDCTAVGYSSKSSVAALSRAGVPTIPLIERLEGSRWRVQHVALPAEITNASDFRGAGLSSVSCPSATTCVAVGSYQREVGLSGGGQQGLVSALFAEQRNGAEWTFEQLPVPASISNPSDAYSVSCSSPTACMVVGDANVENPWALLTPSPSAFADRWDGKTWTSQEIGPPPGMNGAELLGVSCTRASACTAVGWTVGSTHASERTLAERWNGTAWNPATSPNPHHSKHPYLFDVSCTRPTRCTAVGGYGAVLGTFVTRQT